MLRGEFHKSLPLLLTGQQLSVLRSLYTIPHQCISLIETGTRVTCYSWFVNVNFRFSVNRYPIQKTAPPIPPPRVLYVRSETWNVPSLRNSCRDSIDSENTNVIFNPVHTAFRKVVFFRIRLPAVQNSRIVKGINSIRFSIHSVVRFLVPSFPYFQIHQFPITSESGFIHISLFSSVRNKIMVV